MSASLIPLSILDPNDYQRFCLPEDLGSFGSLSTSSGHLPLQSMQLNGQISGLVYQLKLVQRFFNAYSQPLEATYIFPLPGRAAVSSFVMQTHERKIIGQLQERGVARRQYQQAVARGKQAALAEEERSEVFTMTVGNIPAQQFVEIELELHGPLIFTDTKAMFRFPLVVAPRYTPGIAYEGENVGQGTASDTDVVPDASRISPPVLLPGYPNPVQLSIDITVDAGGLSFATPEVSLADLVYWKEAQNWRLTLKPTANRLDRDLILRFPIPAPQMQSSFQLANNYFVLNLIPDDLHQQGPQRPRQLVALLDRSGSMGNWKMVCARRAIGRLIESFTDNDSFQVINFDDRIEYLDPLKQDLRKATDRERNLSLEALSKVEARGSTEILPAIQQGVKILSGQPDPYLILITDGQVSNEAEVLHWVQQHAQGIRIFTVGIDTAVNVSLLERLAQVSGGHFTLVESEQQLDQEMLNLRRRINPPLLQKVSVQITGANCSPVSVDLFQGLPARQLGVLQGNIPEKVEVIGYAADGSAFRNVIPVTHCSGETIHKLWAREKVLELEHGFLAGWNQEEYKPEQIAQFALEHGVLCRFTAFIVIDEESQLSGPQHQVTQAVSSPAGAASFASNHAFMDAFSAGDPFAPTAASLGGDPFAASDPFSGADPFTASDPFLGADPFGPSASPPPPRIPLKNPFDTPTSGIHAPQPTPTISVGSHSSWQTVDTDNKIQAALAEITKTSIIRHWIQPLDTIITELTRQGVQGYQLLLLQDILNHLQAGKLVLTVRAWQSQIEQWIKELLTTPTSSRAETFWK